MFTKIFLLLFLFTSTYLTASATTTGTYYVNTKTLKVRVAPTSKSSHSYSIYKNHKVRVYETKNGWARISPSKNDTEKWVKEKWVFAKFLSPSKSGNTKLTKVLKASDNYAKYAKEFHIASEKLIDDGTCKVKDFKKMRGWVESTPNNLYFTYCGGFSKSNKVYLDINNGKISKPPVRKK